MTSASIASGTRTYGTLVSRGLALALIAAMTGCASSPSPPASTASAAKPAAPAPAIKAPAQAAGNQSPAAAPAVIASAVAPTPRTSAVASLAPTLAAAFAPGVQYVCMTGDSSQPRYAAIEFTSKVADICRRHPEMGPCQYERDLCRKGGGRVYSADGKEITTATEAEYDKRVMRVRFRGD
jgi:hypothetical protein